MIESCTSDLIVIFSVSLSVQLVWVCAPFIEAWAPYFEAGCQSTLRTASWIAQRYIVLGFSAEPEGGLRLIPGLRHSTFLWKTVQTSLVVTLFHRVGLEDALTPKLQAGCNPYNCRVF